MARSINRIAVRPHETEAFAVVSDKGNSYTVTKLTAPAFWYCTCPAFKYNPRNDSARPGVNISNRRPCKHISEVLHHIGINDLHTIEITVSDMDSSGKVTTFAYLVKLNAKNIEYLHDSLTALEKSNRNGR